MTQEGVQPMGYLYSITSDHANADGQRKLGFTTHPIHRMQTYNTGDAPGIGADKRYEALWSISPTTRLRTSEKLLHTKFHSSQQIRAGGNFTEWFRVPLEEVRDFLCKQEFVIRMLSVEEVETIHKLSLQSAPKTPEEKALCDAEDELMREQQFELAAQTTPQQPSLKSMFFETFLPPDCEPRRIQTELWDIVESRLATSSDTPIVGLIQWATGVGKTIGLLILIVLAAEHWKQTGRVYRGLVVAPTNDIFETLMVHFRKLSRWGITLCEGFNSRMSSLHIPSDRPILVLGTHASFTDAAIWERLPPINHVHYDEAHRITGDVFNAQLKQHLLIWNTFLLTGTSATPETCSASQREKLAALFGSPLQRLSVCDVEMAVREGWIAKPRFRVNIVSAGRSRQNLLKTVVQIVDQDIQCKRGPGGSWQGGKVIVYLPSREDVRTTVNEAVASGLWPASNQLFTAVDGPRPESVQDDEAFVAAPANGLPRILFACERYREGADIRGLEMTEFLMGNTVAANILLQVAGRALRNDYEGKEGWCTVIRECEEGVTEDDVLEQIVLDVLELVGGEGGSGGGLLSRTVIRATVEQYFGPVTLSGHTYNVEETVERIQALFVRRALERSTTPRVRYDIVRGLNQEMGLMSKDAYMASRDRHLKWIEDPRAHFRENWTCWLDFLGVDTSRFPRTKPEWVRVCKERGVGLREWRLEEYKAAGGGVDLPLKPVEMYPDYGNWDQEMGREEVEEE